ncbi:MAG: ABC transporter permease, partial [Polyangiales bacterium]
MSYGLQIGWRYLYSSRRATVSMIALIAITGVALGVAALLSVLAITTGFEQAFREKVLGVNAHVLILKYGRDFKEYRDVLDGLRVRPDVLGAAPFLITEMMLSKGDRLSGVLVKGVDPNVLGDVLDLPSQIIEGSLDGLRLPNAKPARASSETVEPTDTKRRIPVWEKDSKKIATLPNVQTASPTAVQAALLDD